MPASVLGKYQDTAHRLMRIVIGVLFMTHGGQKLVGWGHWPWGNRGELPAPYLFGFLFLATAGGGSFSVDAILAKQERD